MDVFRDDGCLYPSRSIQFLNNKVSFGPESKKLAKNLLALRMRAISHQFKKLLLLGADPSFL